MRNLLLSDIHANHPALQAVLDDSRGAFDGVWVLGDTVGYGADPAACIRAIRELDAVVVAGNHEQAVVGRIATTAFNPLARAAVEWTADALGAEELEYLAGLNLKETAGRFTLVHGSPRDPVWEYLRSVEAAVDNLDYFETQACAVGHTHIPFLVSVTGDGSADLPAHTPGGQTALGDERLYLNPGSVGQPRDGDARASYAVVDLDAWSVEFHRCDYDIPEAQARIIDAGLPEFLAARLARGR